MPVSWLRRRKRADQHVHALASEERLLLLAREIRREMIDALAQEREALVAATVKREVMAVSERIALLMIVQEQRGQAHLADELKTLEERLRGEIARSRLDEDAEPDSLFQKTTTQAEDPPDVEQPQAEAA